MYNFKGVNISSPVMRDQKRAQEDLKNQIERSLPWELSIKQNFAHLKLWLFKRKVYIWWAFE